jgi:hypothetical protein
MNPYQSLLGAQWDYLHAHVQRSHTPPLRGTGTANIEITVDPFGRWLSRKLSIPSAGVNVPCTLEVCEEEGGAMLWKRRFGEETLVTRHEFRRGALVEIFPLAVVNFDFINVGGNIRYKAQTARMLGQKLPFTPDVTTLVRPTDTGWQVEVTVVIPVKGRIARYTADMTFDAT